MSVAAIYTTTVEWTGEHWGNVIMGNGPEMTFSAPPEAHGHEGVLTPEDAFVAAINSCIMMMFLWAAKRYKLELTGYRCQAEGSKEIAVDRTERFSQVKLMPAITVAAGDDDPALVRSRVDKAMAAARKYSLVASSINSELIIEPSLEIITCSHHPLPGGKSMSKGG